MEQQYRYLAAQQAFRMYGARYGTRYADYIERQLEAKGYDPNDLSLGEVLAGRAREENDRAE